MGSFRAGAARATVVTADAPGGNLSRVRKTLRGVPYRVARRDWRRPLAWGLLAVAGIWIAVLLLLGGQKTGLGLFDTHAGPGGREHPVARPVR